MVTNSKSSEIYKIMCNVYGKVYLSSKNVYNWAKHGFATTILRRKDSLWTGNKLTVRKKF